MVHAGRPAQVRPSRSDPSCTNIAGNRQPGIQISTAGLRRKPGNPAQSPPVVPLASRSWFPVFRRSASVAFLPHTHLFCYTFSVARIAVFAASQNPAHDQPRAFYSREMAAGLVTSGRAVIVASRAIQLLPVEALSAEQITASGYDAAVGRDRARFFLEVWETRRSGGIEMWQMIPASRR